MKHLVSIALVAGALFAINGYVQKVYRHRPNASLSLPKAPAFELPVVAEDGSLTRRWSLASVTGSPVVLHFGASWCAACEEEKPYLDFLWRQRPKLRFEMVGIRSNDEVAPLVKKERFGVDHYPILLDVDGAVAKNYGVVELPQTIIVAPDGRVMFRSEGRVTDRNGLGGIIRMLSPEVFAVYRR